MPGLLAVSLLLGILLTQFGFAPSPESGDSAYPIGPAEPAPSPDGSRVAFSWAGDLWTVSAAGGIAVRLTDGPAEDERPVWSPDGRSVAFARREKERRDVWIVDVSTGEERQLTRHDASEYPSAFSPDGGVVFFHGARAGGGAIYQVPARGGEIECVVPAPARDGVLFANGDFIFVRGEDPWWRRGGGAPSNCDLWVRTAGGALRRLTTYTGPDLWPMTTRDERFVYYVTEESFQRNVWRLDPKNGKREQITAHRDEGVLFPKASADGRWIFYEHDGRIWKLQVGDSGHVSERAPEPVPIYFPDDARAESPVLREWTSGASRLVVSSSSLYAEIGGDVFRAPLSSVREDTLEFVPVVAGGYFEESLVLGGEDDVRAWVVSDQAGTRDLYRLRPRPSSDGGAPVPPDGAEESSTGRRDDAHGGVDGGIRAEVPGAAFDLVPFRQDRSELDDPVLSPDGQFFAYVKHFEGAQLRLGDPSGGRDVEIARAVDIANPAFSPDGRWIAFVGTDEAGNEDVFVASLFGSGVSNVTLHPASDRRPTFSPDGRWLYFLSDRAGSFDLWGLPLRTSSEPGTEPNGWVGIDFDRIAFRSVQLTRLLGDETDYVVANDGQIALLASALGANDLYFLSGPGGDPVLSTQGVDLRQVVLRETMFGS
ncbi:MAG: hypothetical protein R3E97_16355 [Candidatus Eisenbacteria bacterium]